MEISESPKSLENTTSLENLQTDEQRRVLDTVAEIRKCGLDGILSLPQIVVCGDQSAGKSSVLEALTEIPFPRNDNLCTRFATEIILRRAPTSSLTIKIIPDAARPAQEQHTLKDFHESIINFSDLGALMDKARDVMGVDKELQSTSKPHAFAKDILSIEIEGPSRPQLTLIDIPGLIQTETKGVTKADVDLVAEITDSYISQKRTICLAVVSAMNDYANQKILTKVRHVDPDGDRTLGIITKPDRLEKASGSESAFIALARNEDVFFKLGWHVLKNRSFSESSNSLLERNVSETTFFNTSNFKSLPKDNVGIDALRQRLSSLLFEHLRMELPNLRKDLEDALTDAQSQLNLLGDRRMSSVECRAYLTQLSLKYYEVCKAALEGRYEGDFFSYSPDSEFEQLSPSSIRRLRAAIQHMNTKFTSSFRQHSHKYHIDMSKEVVPSSQSSQQSVTAKLPVTLHRDAALRWVKNGLLRTRGRELIGNYNPLLIGELLWEQCQKWGEYSSDYLTTVSSSCRLFLELLLNQYCPKDVYARLWSSLIEDALRNRQNAAEKELDLLMEDVKSYPINYNHYYTDTINKRRTDREALQQSAEEEKEHKRLSGGQSSHNSASIDIDKAVARFSPFVDRNSEDFSCEEIIDCVLAIYKVQQKQFSANMTAQVIERHLVRGLETIFSPVVANTLSDADVQAIASEPSSVKRQRDYLEDRISKLGRGRTIFCGIMGATALT